MLGRTVIGSFLKRDAWYALCDRLFSFILTDGFDFVFARNDFRIGTIGTSIDAGEFGVINHSFFNGAVCNVISILLTMCEVLGKQIQIASLFLLLNVFYNVIRGFSFSTSIYFIIVIHSVVINCMGRCVIDVLVRLVVFP